ncbi:MAG: hypothetical protein Q8N47_25975 [Bryobacterales bacterium]|nr:hypothetical protein [Bryobacterales bacterium]
MQTSRETNLDLPKECDYIAAKALAGENAIIIFGCLIFLAYASRDAFALDIDDKYACPLCVDGEKQRYPLFDSGTKWTFKWPWRYSVARGHIYFESIGGEDSSGLPRIKAGSIEREVTRYNRKAGTNYHL